VAGRTGAGGRPTDDVAGDGDVEEGGAEEPTVGRRRLWARPSRSRADADSADSADNGVDAEPPDDDNEGDEGDDEELNLKPTAMRGTEPMYAYLVALELIGVSILNLTDTRGKGAPTHPSTELALVGLAVSVALIGVIQTRNRFAVAFGGIIAAFFATLPKVPDSLTLTHLVALVVPVVFAFVLTQRQRKSATAQVRAGRSGTAKGTPSQRRARGTAGRQSRRDRRQAATQTGPQANRRYTPPKTKRPRR